MHAQRPIRPGSFSRSEYHQSAFIVDIENRLLPGVNEVRKMQPHEVFMFVKLLEKSLWTLVVIAIAVWMPYIIKIWEWLT